MHGPFAIDHPYNLIMFARMLAKIAHSFAVAEVGEENFLSYLKPIILGSDLSYIGSVIGQTRTFPENTSLDEAHHIALRCLPSVTGNPVDGEWVTVGIKLFSGHSNVTYSVVAGKLTPTQTYLKWKVFRDCLPISWPNFVVTIIYFHLSRARKASKGRFAMKKADLHSAALYPPFLGFPWILSSE